MSDGHIKSMINSLTKVNTDYGKPNYCSLGVDQCPPKPDMSYFGNSLLRGQEKSHDKAWPQIVIKYFRMTVAINTTKISIM